MKKCYAKIIIMFFGCIKKIGPHSVHVWLTIRIKLNYLKKIGHKHFEVIKISPYYKHLVIEFEITQLKI